MTKQAFIFPLLTMNKPLLSKPILKNIKCLLFLSTLKLTDFSSIKNNFDVEDNDDDDDEKGGSHCMHL